MAAIITFLEYPIWDVKIIKIETIEISSIVTSIFKFGITNN